MAQFTTEQFEQLMQAVGHYNVRSGSLSNCTARYAGERDSTKVEEFIAAVGTFKAVEKISDADAITGMPMILEGDAAEWWRGVQPKPKVFEDVVRMLREAFCPPKPDWRIYAEMIESKQAKNEPTDSFVRRKRALFSQLTNAPSEIGQIDLLFGMIHLQIRDRVSRKRITTFDDLLNEAREAEMTLREHKMTTANADKAVDSTSGPVRCGFCRKKGHYTEVCFKKKNEEAKTAQTQAIANALVTKPSYSCYGCNAPGVTRANCRNV
ncbi:activity-regulated cytoskeleton associated protein 2-like [Anastrepha ludens]|uniref:activity-regulated cytoskeleton associated protein 2-like n=1 Tax=Anastrepha ludens TaxID=28586 RepID=UPI0023B0924B|nr:activity-regulated cytoskeleton associated protein 2-like [Anastrepha ludens]